MCIEHSSGISTASWAQSRAILHASDNSDCLSTAESNFHFPTSPGPGPTPYHELTLALMPLFLIWVVWNGSSCSRGNPWSRPRTKRFRQIRLTTWQRIGEMAQVGLMGLGDWDLTDLRLKRTVSQLSRNSRFDSSICPQLWPKSLKKSLQFFSHVAKNGQKSAKHPIFLLLSIFIQQYSKSFMIEKIETE